MIKRGFSLLETLIAAGILITVTLAVVALSNSLIAGTVVNADKTVIDRWAAEGLELTQKIRDDNLLNPASAPAWFAPALADNGASYGWYKLTPPAGGSGTASMTPVVAGNGNFDKKTFESSAETLTSDQTVGFRLICVEAVAASAAPTNAADNTFHCNTQGANTVKDGLRTNLVSCQAGDLYCQMTNPSVQKNQLGSTTIIPAGSAVKIRSVVVWEIKDQVHSASVATLLTNWKGYEQQ